MTPAAQTFVDSQSGLSERDARLLRRAVETLCRNTVGPVGKPWAPHRGVIPAFGTYEGVWNWDAAFHAIAIGRWDPELALEQTEIFFEHQKPNGGFVDVLFANGEVVTDFGKPPVWPWAMRMLAQRVDVDLARAYSAFELLERHWVRYRADSRMDLFHYDTDAVAEPTDPAKPSRLQQVKFESGWDDSVRWDDGIREVWPVDLNGYMVLFYEALADLAGRLGLSSQVWRDRQEFLAQLIEQRLWDDGAGAYCDFNFAAGAFTGILSPASFVPLFAGAASPERAARMAGLAGDPERFFPGMPTVEYRNPEYSRTMWRGPCWLNTAYFALKGLQRYGHTDVANGIRDTILDWCDADPDLREYYDAKTGEGLGAKGFGWTAAFVLELILDWNVDTACLPSQ